MILECCDVQIFYEDLQIVSSSSDAGDFITLVSRITGILFGVAVSLLLAVVVSRSPL